MRTTQRNQLTQIARRWRTLAGALVMALFVSACDGERTDDDGTVFNTVLLPTDTLLNLACADAGIFLETCVLEDPENPFVTVPIPEFDPNNPDAISKFELIDNIPFGPEGAKARFYFWATALARRSSGENQYFTALALHELFDANSDPLIQEQALKAYRSVLENYFGSVVFFTCCTASSPDGTPVPFPVTLNELVADNLFRTDATGFVRLIPGDPILALSLIGEWGFTYRPATPPLFNDGLVFVNGG
ncbi:MAG: hypothetical protein AAGL69_03080 [Pseudomonadota bacterium]